VESRAVWQAQRSAWRNVPSFELAIDAPVIAAGGLAIAIPYAFANDLIHPHCPCAPATVNAFDRHVVGNHNKLLDDASDATAGVVMVARPAERVAAGRHFYTDVAVGAVAGAAVGTLVPLAHRRADLGTGGRARMREIRAC